MYTKTVFNIETGRIESLHWIKYSGPIAKCKGASAQQNQISQAQQNFYNTLSQNYSTMFAGQNAILKSLTDAFTPILNAGPTQAGWSPQQAASFQTQALGNVGTQYANAQRVLNEQYGTRGGGNVYLPSGTQAQLQAGLEQGSANETANTLNALTQENYAIGRQNWLAAAQGLGSTAAMFNPTGFAGASNQAGGQAFDSATTIQKTNAAASPWAAIGGALGGIGGAFLGNPMLGMQIGAGLGGGLSGAGAAGVPDISESGGFSGFTNPFSSNTGTSGWTGSDATSEGALYSSTPNDNWEPGVVE